MSGHLVRRQITLPPGTTVIPHNLSLPDPANLMILPLVPLGGWDGVEFVGQPDRASFTMLNATGIAVILNVGLFVPPEFLGVAQADDYA